MRSVFEKIEAINHDNGVTVLIVEQSPEISVHRRLSAVSFSLHLGVSAREVFVLKRQPHSADGTRSVPPQPPHRSDPL
jgi:hypothetical protein